MIRMFCCGSLLLLALGASGSAQTEDTSVPVVDRFVRDALKAHHAGNSQEAIELLQRAIDTIQQSGANSLASHLPAVPPKWTAEEPQTVTGNWGAGAQAVQWTQVSRVYISPDGLRVNVQFTNSPQLIMPQRQMATMFANEQYLNMMNMDPNKKVKSFQKPGWSGWTMVEKGGKASGVALGNALMVTLDVSRDVDEVFTKFWQSVNFEGLRSFDKK